ncbi:hypothetical protein VAE151_500089 [Vibrio aestuarianus]|uniref:Uncharacterized protein n=1 Tax=Vibrio aestuarianus TaxID=28171 RepID=A0ABM9FMN5_9VIBR|nr:hypothetical protein VIBAE_A10088 [Vibrio aestuarianus subsp. francensis]CAH8182743.1 hypothetical protein VAE032_220088 [Vibrio aestuarianus]CAH8182821.1 hypothetical protein VAE055_320088 [Vibrio aestuarianus]CAH8182908.1 hypothetical protein VAE128_420088 [Vibrio aestuarianus]CAH8182989.1 hypothetical protein VAE130_530089 [Vibrio aestuarianus]
MAAVLICVFVTANFLGVYRSETDRDYSYSLNEYHIMPVEYH